MDELISRPAAINAVLDLDVSNRVSWRDAVIDTLDNLPSAQPVRHGKWIKHMKVVHHENFDSYTPWWQCSECGQCYDATFANICNYCYYCGAKMVKGEEDEVN